MDTITVSYRNLSSDFQSLFLFVLFAGVIIFIVAFFGCCGAWRESSCMVYTYAALLTIILIGKLIVCCATSWQILIRGCLSRSHFFPSRIRFFPIPDTIFIHPGSSLKNSSLLTPKILFWARKYVPVVHPGSGSWFFTHPGSRIQGVKKGTGSRIRIRNTASRQIRIPRFIRILSMLWSSISRQYRASTGT